MGGGGGGRGPPIPGLSGGRGGLPPDDLMLPPPTLRPEGGGGGRGPLGDGGNSLNLNTTLRPNVFYDIFLKLCVCAKLLTCACRLVPPQRRRPLVGRRGKRTAARWTVAEYIMRCKKQPKSPMS